MGSATSSRRLVNWPAERITTVRKGFRNFVAEEEPFGLKTLYNPKSAVADIVFVHGLTGHREKTWTHSEALDAWPKSLLPKRIPQARIMTFGYDANVTHWWKLASMNRIGDHSQTLLFNLANLRFVDGTDKRPLIFVTHSLGGLVCKDALTRSQVSPEKHYQKVLEATSGLMFLGTPHRGAEGLADVAEMIASLAGIVKHVNADILRVLKTDSEMLSRIQDDFHSILRQRHSVMVNCAFEELPVRKFGMGLVTVVPQRSAVIDAHPKFGIHADHMNMTKFKHEDDPGFTSIALALQRMVNEAQGTQGPHETTTVSSKNSIYFVPKRSSNVFTERTHLFQKLEKSLPPPQVGDKQRCVVLHGYGGSGKSQVALKFAERFRDRYWCVLWIDASSKRAAEKEFKEIARIADVDESVPSVRHWLQNAAKPWLLIVDGADDPDHDVTQYLPMSNHGHTLITSRDPSCAMLLRSAAHEVEVMDHEEGKQLIFKALNITEPSEENIVSAGRIVSELGGLPLALVHAAAAIRQRYFTLDTYLDHYSSHRKELLEKQLMDGVGNRNYTGAVYTTCEISLKKIESKQLQDSTNAIEMMNIFAFFHFDSIPIDVFERAWRNRGAFSSSRKQILSGLGVLNQQTQEWNPFPVLDSLRLLGSQSLLEHGTEEESNSLDRRRVSTHRVVHGWAHDRLPEHERQRFMDLATSLLAESIPMGHDDDSSAYRKALMPHIDYCLRLGTNNDRWFRSDYSERWRLTYGSKFAFVYSEFGRFRETEKIQQRVMRGCQHLLGPNSRETLRATIDLANTFRRQGRLDKARNIQWEVLQSMKSVLGDKDLDTLTAQCGLADTYRDQGLWKEAADLEKGVMEDRVEVLGPNHPDTLKAAADLAKTYRRLGNFELAKLLQKQVLENSSDSNIDTLKVKGQLADTYRDQGRWDEAEQLEKEVIAELEKVVPRDHPHMLIAKGDLAASYLGKDQWEDAERLLEEVVSSMDHVLGNKHPHKLKMAAKLAIAYRGQGRLDDAHSLLLHIISEMEDLDGVLIRDHPDLVRAKGYLADTYRQMDRLDDAQALGEVVLESARRIIGEVHPYTREIALGLAETYLRRGRMDDAKSLRAKF